VASKDANSASDSASTRADARRPTEIDRRIGRLIRERRQFLQLTIEDLARALSVTSHQLQKYETGENRISASRLVECGRALDVHVAWFYQSISDTRTKAKEGVALNDQEQKLLTTFRALPPGSRRQLSEIAAVLTATGSSKKKK
jgi:transcriptional regulator with XRE-family HTH domain